MLATIWCCTEEIYTNANYSFLQCSCLWGSAILLILLSTKRKEKPGIQYDACAGLVDNIRIKDYTHVSVASFAVCVQVGDQNAVLTQCSVLWCTLRPTLTKLVCNGPKQALQLGWPFSLITSEPQLEIFYSIFLNY